MIHTQYTNLRDNDLLRLVDSKTDATPLEIELSLRLEQRMDTKEFAPARARDYTHRARP